MRRRIPLAIVLTVLWASHVGCSKSDAASDLLHPTWLAQSTVSAIASGILLRIDDSS